MLPMVAGAIGQFSFVIYVQDVLKYPPRWADYHPSRAVIIGIVSIITKFWEVWFKPLILVVTAWRHLVFLSWFYQHNTNYFTHLLPRLLSWHAFRIPFVRSRSPRHQASRQINQVAPQALSIPPAIGGALGLAVLAVVVMPPQLELPQPDKTRNRPQFRFHYVFLTAAFTHVHRLLVAIFVIRTPAKQHMLQNKVSTDSYWQVSTIGVDFELEMNKTTAVIAALILGGWLATS